MLALKEQQGTTNWLALIAIEAGHAPTELLRIDPKTPSLRLWDVVTRACDIDPKELARLVADRYQLSLAMVDDSDRQATRLVPEKVARRYCVLPLKEVDRRLVVATCDPRDLELEEALRFASGRFPSFQVAPPQEIVRAIEERYSPASALEAVLRGLDGDSAKSIRVVSAELPESVQVGELEAGPVVKLTELIIGEAVRNGASDIHIEPDTKGGAFASASTGSFDPT